MHSDHSRGIAIDISGDETVVPLLRAVFGESAVIEHWHGGVQKSGPRQLEGPCVNGGIHESVFNGGHPVGHWLCARCGAELCASSGGCVRTDEEPSWRL